MVTCKVCSIEESKYTCPRCEIAYCSLACYKNHSGDCLEAFYKSQVEHELSHQKTTPEEKQKLEEVMRRLKRIDRDESDEEDEENVDETEEEKLEREKFERLQKLADKEDLDVEDLTPEEKELFDKFVQLQIDNQGNNLDMPVWQPWWESTVIDLEEIPTQDQVKNVEPLGRPANVLVGNGVFQVVFAYCHMARTYNGEWKWDYGVATKHILGMATSTCKDVRYGNPAEMFMELSQASYEMNRDNEFANNCLDDASKLLLASPDHLAKAFSDILWLLQESSSKIDEKHKKRFLRCTKKVEFFRSYAVHCWEDLRPIAMLATNYSQANRNAKQEADEKKKAADQQRDIGPDGVLLPEGVKLPTAKA